MEKQVNKQGIEVRSFGNGAKPQVQQGSRLIEVFTERAQARHNARTPQQIADIQKRWDERNKKYRKRLQNEARARFAGTQVPTAIGAVTITNTSIKEFINQPHAQYRLKNELARKLDQVIKDATYIGRSKYHKDGKSNIIYSHIFEVYIDNKKSWLIARETDKEMIYFHSITDQQNVTDNLN